MRLTVGPLPPAVYWRRRAIVLAALLLGVFGLASYCGGGDRSGAADSSKTGNEASPVPSASVELLTPTVGGGDLPSATPSAGPASEQAQPTGPCTDEEIQVTVAIDGGKTEVFVGDSLRMYLRVKNVSSRTCERDIGATQQELRFMQGAQKMWSSDDCGAPTGSLMRTLRPGEQVTTSDMTWTGRSSTDCQTRAAPAPGAYQLFGRVGTRHSEPVALTIKARS